MEAGKRTINDIFNGNRIIEIPFFQRSYVWEESQWERLLQDMENISATNRPYFLGSVILKQQQIQSNNSIGDRRTLVDGQQRLTTLNILFKVLCLKKGNPTFFDRVFRLMNNQELSLWHNHNDVEDFTKVLNLETEEELVGDSQIIRAYNYFRTEIELNKIDLNRILTNIMFVGIDLGVNEDEQEIFDTINSLGVRLTTAELLKNFLFCRDDLKTYNENWKRVFEEESEKDFWDREISTSHSRANIDLFFYSFLQMKIQNSQVAVKADDKKLFSRMDGLFDSYKKFIQKYNIDKNSLIKEIKEYAKIYKSNFDFEIVEKELPATSGIERVNAIIFGFENTTLIPYVLYLLKNVTDNQELNRIFDYLESFLLRRVVVKATTKNYRQLFSETLIANNVVTKEKLQEHIEKQLGKANFMPSNDQLNAGFQSSKLVNKHAAGLLYMIESKIRNRSMQSTSLLGINKYSLEHVMPKKWENNWPAVASDTEKLKRNQLLLTLGNLTIITASLNSSIRDSDWSTKKEGKNGQHGLRHFASGIETFAPYLAKSDWNEDVILNRAKDLFDKALKIWPVS